jgi:hypothetical protein
VCGGLGAMPTPATGAGSRESADLECTRRGFAAHRASLGLSVGEQESL